MKLFPNDYYIATPRVANEIGLIKKGKKDLITVNRINQRLINVLGTKPSDIGIDAKKMTK